MDTNDDDDIDDDIDDEVGKKNIIINSNIYIFYIKIKQNKT